MSMPVAYIDPDTAAGDASLSLNDALNNVLIAIGMEEAALSHIINAEAEKMQLYYSPDGNQFQDTESLNTNDYLHLNRLVDCMLSSVNGIECTLLQGLVMTMSVYDLAAAGWDITVPTAAEVGEVECK